MEILKGTRVLVKGECANQFGVVERDAVGVFSDHSGVFKKFYVRLDDGSLVFVPEGYVRRVGD